MANLPVVRSQLVRWTGRSLPRTLSSVRPSRRFSKANSLHIPVFPTLHPLEDMPVFPEIEYQPETENFYEQSRWRESMALLVHQMLSTYLVEENLYILTTAEENLSSITIHEMLNEVPEELMSVLLAELSPYLASEKAIANFEDFIFSLNTTTKNRIKREFSSNPYFNNYENLVTKQTEMRSLASAFSLGFSEKRAETRVLTVALDAVFNGFQLSRPHTILLEISRVLLTTPVLPDYDLIAYLSKKFHRLGMTNYSNLLYHLTPFLLGFDATPARLLFRMSHALANNWSRDFMNELRFFDINTSVHLLDNHYHYNNTFTTHVSLHPFSKLTRFQKYNHTVVEIDGFAEAIAETKDKACNVGPSTFEPISNESTNAAVSNLRPTVLAFTHTKDIEYQSKYFHRVERDREGPVRLSPSVHKLLFQNTTASVLLCPMKTYKAALRGCIQFEQFPVFDTLCLKMLNNTILDTNGDPYVVVGGEYSRDTADVFRLEYQNGFVVPYPVKLINNLANINIINDSYRDCVAAQEKLDKLGIHLIMDKEMLSLLLSGVKQSQDIERLRWISPLIHSYLQLYKSNFEKEEIVKEMEYLMGTRIRKFVHKQYRRFRRKSEAQREAEPLLIMLENEYFANSPLNKNKPFDALLGFQILSVYMMFKSTMAHDLREFNKVLDFENSYYKIFHMVEAEMEVIKSKE
ncbi:hypothetical protein BABINDRAFT_161424 [Babjeviella inositovora NRRL Y-12698]|uniref:Uncharacterized protein n=1 Tax=Babjeviella inositovora NRRL Y-12698 TaxID=984486 RepID=A0A1E3QPW9_9ASCO|nr:uncharacterized protein BABINDRAFT_161424 [Babjeviella inositovora NRRL Y-12698]ODQ79711.1 hypothetical protein BABINDRAFT_161424 [Babjeviella inositovora NRRL Y-12698]